MNGLTNDKSAEEIVLALRICNRSKGHRCSECPVFSQYEHGVCKRTVDRAAAGLIESQAAEIAELRERVTELEGELEESETGRQAADNTNSWNASRADELEAQLTASQQEKWAAVEAINRIVDSLGGNRPLTLDELRGMDGEPVWIVDSGTSENSGWYLVNLKYEPFFDKPDVTWDVLMSNDGQYFTMIQVGKGLTAYRRKPEPEGA